MRGSLSPAGWATTQTPVALLVIRLLLVANVVVLVPYTNPRRGAASRW